MSKASFVSKYAMHMQEIGHWNSRIQLTAKINKPFPPQKKAKQPNQTNLEFAAHRAVALLSSFPKQYSVTTIYLLLGIINNL